jgi:hypothetical protein
LHAGTPCRDRVVLVTSPSNSIWPFCTAIIGHAQAHISGLENI